MADSQLIPLFGRDVLLNELIDRVQSPGLTAVFGRPQIGKSRLVRDEAIPLLEKQDWSVGYVEASGASTDLVARALQDLYRRWLSQTDFLEQAKLIWTQQKDTLIERLGTRVGSLLGKLYEKLSDAKGASEAVDTFFTELRSMNEKLRTGGLVFAPLEADQVRDLLLMISELTKNRALLVIDAWEQSQNPTADAATLQTLVKNKADWPDRLRVIVVVRDHEPQHETYQLAKQLCKLPRTADFPVRAMELDEPGSARMLAYVRDRISGVADQSNDEILSLIAGNPAVLDRWIESEPRARDQAVDLAKKAQDYRYDELPGLLKSLRQENPDLFRLALRLAMLPEQSDRGIWQFIKPAVMRGLSPALLAELCLSRLIETDEPPRFGHTTRYEAIHRLVTEEETLRPLARRELEPIIIALCGLVSSGNPAFVAAVSLVQLERIAIKTDIDPGFVACCSLVRSLLPGLESFASNDQMRSAAMKIARKNTETASLVSAVLFNTLNDAMEEKDLKRRDKLLDELRALSVEHGDDARVRETLAIGLFNTMIEAGRKKDLKRRDRLLDELRELSVEHGDDAGVREQLGMGLFNTLNDAKEEKDFKRRDKLLDELRALYIEHGDDAGVREQLTKGLFNTLVAVMEEKDFKRRDKLLDELRALSVEHGDDARVRETLAMGLFNTLVAVMEEKDLKRRDKLLDELRALYIERGDDAGVREQLGMGLFNTLVAVMEEKDLKRRDKLLDELRALYIEHGDDAGVREQLTKGLLKTLIRMTEDKEPERSGVLLRELRTISVRTSVGSVERRAFAIALAISAALHEELGKTAQELELRLELDSLCQSDCIDYLDSD